MKITHGQWKTDAPVDSTSDEWLSYQTRAMEHPGPASTQATMIVPL